MKLFIPVVGIIFSIGACCCGNMDELTEKMDEIKVEAPMDGGSTTTTTTSSTTTTSGSSEGDAVDGACGRFKDWGVKAPSGFKSVACSDDAGSGGLVLQGSGSPADACKVIKAWAEGTGAKLTTESNMGGTTALIYQKDDTQITAACTDATGQTTVSISLSKS